MTSVLFVAMTGCFVGLGGRLFLVLFAALLVGAVCIFDLATSFSWHTAGGVLVVIVAFNVALLAGYAARYFWVDGKSRASFIGPIPERSKMH